MLSDESPNASATSDRRDAVREKGAAGAGAAVASTNHPSLPPLAIVLIAVVAVAARRRDLGGVVGSLQARAEPRECRRRRLHRHRRSPASPPMTEHERDDPTLDPATATAAPAPNPATPAPTRREPAVDIRVYVDYLSPGSQDFQLANVAQLSKWVTQDAATLTYYPVAMLTAKSNGTRYSLRAASAAACVAHPFARHFFAFTTPCWRSSPPRLRRLHRRRARRPAPSRRVPPSPKLVRSCIEAAVVRVVGQGCDRSRAQGIPRHRRRRSDRHSDGARERHAVRRCARRPEGVRAVRPDDRERRVLQDPATRRRRRLPPLARPSPDSRPAPIDWSLCRLGAIGSAPNL